jgi:hypothetical protein
LGKEHDDKCWLDQLVPRIWRVVGTDEVGTGKGSDDLRGRYHTKGRKRVRNLFGLRVERVT